MHQQFLRFFLSERWMKLTKVDEVDQKHTAKGWIFLYSDVNFLEFRQNLQTRKCGRRVYPLDVLMISKTTLEVKDL